MADFDKQMADRVWQRVRETTQNADMNLRGMIQEEMAAAELYRQLARQLETREREGVMALARGAQTRAECLRGIHRLTAGEKISVKVPRPVQERSELLLRRAYGGSLKQAANYEKLAGNGEYGHVFAALAAQTRQSGQRILEVLGRMEGQRKTAL